MQTEPITLRVATGDDAPALVRPAGLDDAEGPTAAVVALLRERRVQIATETTSAGGRRARLRARLRGVLRRAEVAA